MSTIPDFNLDDLEQEPLARAQTIPSEWYHSRDILDFEKEYLFSEFWQLACHESQLAEPGDMYTLEVADNPILIVRDSERTLRAFYNVCKHRGGPVAVKKGTTSVLQCKYHGWTYRLDGTLRGVPQFNKVDLFDKEDFGLEPIELKTWQGFVFINLRANKPLLNNLLDGVSKRISPISLKDFKHYTDERYEIDCNWKVYVDNFLEGYHIPIVHPELAKLLDYSNYTVETAPWYSLQHSPLKEEDNIYGSGKGEAFYYFIFPNIMLNILPGRVQTNVIRPLSTGKTEVLFSYYYEDISSPEALESIRNDIDYSHKIQLEDVEICEEVQKGLRSKAYDKGRFSVEREEGVYHFQTLLKKVFKEKASHR